MSRLKRPEFFRLTQWVQGKRELLLENAPTLVDLARLSSKDLGLDVPVASVREAIQITQTKYNPRVLNGTMGNKKAHIRLDAMDAIIRRLEAEVAVLRGVIRDAVGPLPGDPVRSTTVAVANGKHK